MSRLQLKNISVAARAGVGGLALLAALLSAPLAWVQEPSEDPVPIRRVLLDPARIPPELQQQKELLSLPRGEFEDTVRKASRAVAAAKNPPRLLEARYHATLVEGQLVGRGEFTILNPQPVPALFRLDPWSLALRHDPQLNGRPALLGELDPKTPAVLLESGGTQTLRFQWSARGEQRPEGLQFDVRAPAAPLAVLQLDLPADHKVLAAGGPVPEAGPADSATSRRWQVAFGGQSDLDLLIRAGADAGKPALLLARQRAFHDLSLSGTDARFELDLECFHSKLADLKISLDPSLEPTDVNWMKQPVPFQVASEGESRVLTVRFPEPFQGRGTLEVRSRSGPLRPASRRTFASLHPRGAVMGRETIQIRTSPEIVLTDWQFGDFRAVSLQAAERESSEVFTLVQEGISPEAGPRPPSVRVNVQAADVTVQQDSWWHIHPEESRLVVRTTWQLRAGRVFRLSLALPAGWDVEELELSNPEQLGGWHLAHDWYAAITRGDGRLLVADLKWSPAPQSPLSMTLWLRPAGQSPAMTKGGSLSVPRVTPLGVRWLEGNLAITLEKALGPQGQPRRVIKATPRDISGRETRPPTGPGLLWADKTPDFHYTYHGEGLSGSLSIERLAPEVRAETTVEVTWRADRRTLNYYLVLQPLAGSADLVLLWYSQPPPALQWEVLGGTNRVVEFRRRQKEGEGELWELHFERPLLEPTFLQAEADLPVESKLPVPLLAVKGATETEGQLLLRLDSGCEVRLEAKGLQPTAPRIPPRSKSTPPVWRAFRYGHEAFALTLHDQVDALVPSVPVVESATLTRSLDSAGTVFSHYDCRVSGLRDGTTLSVALPEGTELTLLRVDGLTVAAPDLAAGRLSLPARGATARYEIAFVQHADSWRFAARLTDASPQWDSSVRVLNTRRLWCLPEDMVPLASGGWQKLPGPFAGESPLHASSATPVSFTPSSATPGWTWWEQTGETGASSALFIRGDLSPYAGILIALAVLFVLWGLRNRPRLRTPFWFAVGLLSCVSLLWLPEVLRPLGYWPLLAVLLAWLLNLPRRLGVLPSGTFFSARGSSLAASLLVLGLIGPIAQAQRPAEEGTTADSTVYILAGSPDRLDLQTVLVPRTLWSKLTDTAKGTTATLPDYALLEAAYLGTVADKAVQLEVICEVQVFKDGPVSVALPLGGARLLESPLLDGAPVLATPLRRGEGAPEGFVIDVAGKGLHEIRLKLEAGLRVRSDERELRCTVPVVTASRLVLDVPKPARAVQAVGIDGGQWIHDEPGRVRLEADLGRVPELVVRWRTDAAEATEVRVQEAYLWEFQPQDVTLHGRLHYEVTRGAVSQLQLQLPACVEVQSVEVKAESGQQPLKDWSLISRQGQRLLVLELRQPMTGRLRVSLEMPVRGALAVPWVELAQAERLLEALAPGRPALLPLLLQTDLETMLAPAAPRLFDLRAPRPVGAKRLDGLFGYRLDQLTVDRTLGSWGLKKIPEARIAAVWPREWSNPSGLNVSQFGESTAPQLLLRVRPALPQLTARQELTLWLDLAEVEVRAKGELSITAGSVSYVEWMVPPNLSVADVQGDDLQRWNQQGTRLRLWFKHPIDKETSFTLSGWLAPVREGPGAAEVSLPALRLVGAKTQTTRLTVQRRGAVAARPVRLRGLRTLPPSGASEDVLHALFTEQPDYGGALKLTVAVKPAPTPVPTEPTPKQPSTAGSGPKTDISIFGAEYESRILGADRWLHEARYTLLHEAGADLILQLPEDALLLRVAIDDRDVAPLTRAPTSVRVPLPASAGWCRVLVRWSVEGRPESQESLLATPRIANAASFPAAWTVYASLQNGVKGAGGPNAAAWHQIHLAEGQLQLILALADRFKAGEAEPVEASVLTAQQRFYQQVRTAEQQLRLAGRGADTSANQRLTALQQQNLRRFQNTPWERLRKQAETASRNPDVENKPEAGSPVHYFFEQNPQELSVPVLTAANGRLQRAILGTVLFVILAVLALLASRSPWAGRLSSVLWPELLAGAGFLAGLLLDLPVAGFVMILIGVVARLTLIVAWTTRSRYSAPSTMEATLSNLSRSQGSAPGGSTDAPA